MDIGAIVQWVLSDLKKCIAVSILCIHVYCIKCDLKILYKLTLEFWTTRWQVPMGGSGEGIYKRSDGENWASEISRLGAGDPEWTTSRQHLLHTLWLKKATKLYYISYIQINRINATSPLMCV